LTEAVPYPASSAAYPVAKPQMATDSWPLAVAAQTPPAQDAPIFVPDAVSPKEQSEKPVFFDLKPVAPPAEVEPSISLEVHNVAVQEDQVVAFEEVRIDAPQELDAFEPELQSPVSPFEISGTLTHEPQTNSIVIDEIMDPMRVSDIVTDAGMILRTGSIDIVPVTTGQISIIPESPESDVSDSIDSASSFVPSVAPLRASGVMNSKAQVGALPTGRRRLMDVTITSVTLGIVILTVSTLAVIGYMLGVLR